VHDVDNLFAVDFTTKFGGGCLYVGKNGMNTLLNDVVVLAGSFLEALNDYGNGVIEARRLIDVFNKPR